MNDEDRVDSHVLSSPYIKSVRLTAELMAKHNVSSKARDVYNFMSHNCNLQTGITHRAKISDIHKFANQGRAIKIRALYRCIAELEETGLITIQSRAPEGWIFYLPMIEFGAKTAKKHAIESQDRQLTQKIEAEIEKRASQMERRKNRELTYSEMAAIRNVVERKYMLTDPD